jgi:hypothetical protein
MSIIYITGVLSLIIQIITGLFDYYVLGLPIPADLNLLRELVLVEFIVQIIEGVFYIWMVMNFSHIKNITPKRYFDWVLTTPSMLLTYSIFLLYLKESYEINEKKKSGIEIEKTDKIIANKGIKEVIRENWRVLLPIILLNWIMLLFGFLGEINIIPMITANILGFIPFFAYFAIIYYHFARDFTIGRVTFAIFFGLWLLYGVAAFFPYYIKNTAFNILDLFAKNFFGIFLGVVLIYKLKTREPTTNKAEIDTNLENKLFKPINTPTSKPILQLNE